MPDRPNGPLSAGVVTPLAGMPSMRMIDFDPDVLTEGVIVTVQAPGAIDLILTERIARGSMLAIIPPEMAAHSRAQLRRTLEAQTKGQKAS